MRIAHIESSLDWGGQELRILEQTEWLNQHGYPSWIVARPGSAILCHANERGLPVSALDIRGSSNPTTLYTLYHCLRKNNIDIIDCHGNRDSTYGAYLKWLTNMPVVRSRHVTDPIELNAFKRLVWRYGNHSIIVTANRIRTMLSQTRLADRQKVYVAVPGVDEKRFSPACDGRLLRVKLGIPLDHLVIANIGMIRPDKGQLYFVRACRALLTRHANISCIQLGDATGQTQHYKQQVLNEAADEVANGRIHFYGYQRDIENWLALSDIVVIASVATEAQTRVVAQAFLMKKNVIATSIGGLPEMIAHEQTGLLVAPADDAAIVTALERLMAEPGLAVALREQAYQHALQYMSFNYMMQGMLNWYHYTIELAGLRPGS